MRFFVMWMFLCLALHSGWAYAGPPAEQAEPTVRHIGLVAPDLMGVTIRHGKVTQGQQQPYQQMEGDVLHVQGDHGSRYVRRDGVAIGTLVGREQDILWTFDRFEDVPLQIPVAMQPEAWHVLEGDQPIRVLAVDRRSKPVGMARVGEWAFGFPVEHTLYLRLERPLVGGERYTVELQGHTPTLESIVLDFMDDSVRSEAIHVTHAGFAPGDVKTAFLSTWAGSAGPVLYPDGMAFRVIRDTDRQTVFRGVADDVFRKGQAENDLGLDHTMTDVHRLDFSALTEPGTYRVVVDGVGTSYPFEIASDVYHRPLITSARGLLHHRSGIELGPPHTSYKRPRPMHPDDGFQVWQAKTRLVEPGSNENNQEGIFKRLQRESKTELNPNAWGGYMDAGDFDRREPHLLISRLLLELAELYPQHVQGVSLNIPESGNALPDLVDEALFGASLFRRMQTPDGGIPGWVESAEHPRLGETSWQESLDVFVTAPDPLTSYHYAATATQAATVLAMYSQPEEAAGWLDSALKAWEYAERHNQADGFAPLTRDDRALAAVMLYRETGEERFHEVYREITVLKDENTPIWVWEKHDERQPAFVYARLKGHRPIDERLRDNAIKATLREAADWGLRGVQRTAFRWASNPHAGYAWGTGTSPAVISNVRAYHLTGDRAHLQAVQLSLGFTLGANPMNMSMMTGLGPNPVVNPLHIDSRFTNQPSPEGITVYGPVDPRAFGDFWFFEHISPSIYPDYRTWPTVDSYYDVWWMICSNEYTVQQTIGPVTYLLGVLDAEAAASRQP